ncbi:MAG: DNA polymerase III subunit beta, partial [Spirochaetales bacterium]|nr:DNA polymerase III subunit beta [Spirochaetales bacterium]
MKFNIEKDHILEALQKVQSIVGQRAALPILSNVLLEAENGRLMLTTTDTEVSVRTSIDADIEREGSTTLPARRFFSICRDLPSHLVEIDVNNSDVAKIVSGSYSCKLEGLAHDDFPPMPSFEENSSYKLKQEVLKDALQKTSYAASTDQSRAILTGTLMSFRDNKLTVVCTDGRRLALVEQEIDLSGSMEIDIVVPIKTVNELIKTLDEGEAVVKTSSSQMAVEFDNSLIISKLIDGTYPNYRQVIPSQCEERIAIERETLQSAIRRVSLMLDDQAASVLVKITENRMELVTS